MGFCVFCLLNTDLQFKNISGEVMVLTPNIAESITVYIENGIVFIRVTIKASLQPFVVELFKIPEKYAPRMITDAVISNPADADDFGRIASANITSDGICHIWQITPLKYGEPFMIQYPLKRS